VGRTANRYLFDLHRKPEDTVWLVGDGRSGTTWLSNMINCRGNYRFLFEPFHPRKVGFAKRYDLFEYRRPDEEDEDLFALYSRIFVGSIQDPEIDRFNSGIVFSKRLVKDIFSHLCMKWIDVRFPEVRKILLLRHPFSVAVAKRKMKKLFWMTEPAEFLAQKKLHEDHLREYTDIIRSADSLFEKQVVIWSIVNSVPFAQLQRDDVCIVFYEDLCVEPEGEMRKIFRHVGERSPEALGPELARQISRPSQVTRTGVKVDDKLELLREWQRTLSAVEVRKGLRILEAFGLGGLYGDDVMPERSAIELLLDGQGSSAPEPPPG